MWNKAKPPVLNPTRQSNKMLSLTLKLLLILAVALLLLWAAVSFSPTKELQKAEERAPDCARPKIDRHSEESFANDPEMQYIKSVYLKDRDICKALSVVQDLVVHNLGSRGNCHRFIHVLGHIAYQATNCSHEVLACFRDKCNEYYNFCNGAYMHGIIETYLMDSHSEGDLIMRARFIARQVCKLPDPIVSTGADWSWECYHGIGHGIVLWHRTFSDCPTEWHETIKATIRGCKESCPSRVHDCLNGAEMQLWHYEVDDPKEMYRVVNGSSLALSLGDKTSLLYRATSFLIHFPGDYVGAVEYCAAHAPHFYGTCFMQIGIQMGKEKVIDRLFFREIAKDISRCVKHRTTDAKALKNAMLSFFRGVTSYWQFSFGPKMERFLLTQAQKDLYYRSKGGFISYCEYLPAEAECKA